jgi:hypothetical protein
MKKPRLFYWEAQLDTWCFINEEVQLRFMRKDMTDEEVENLPDV